MNRRRHRPSRVPPEPDVVLTPPSAHAGGRRAKPRKSLGVRLAKTVIWTLSSLFAIVAGAVLYIGFLLQGMPEPEIAADLPRRPGVVVLDRDGREIARRGPVAPRAVSLDALPSYLPDAVIAIEDRRFRSHAGVDAVGLGRAALANLRAGHVVQGGSTLTQQLAKNLFLESDRTLSRKGREALLAVWLESRYTKDELIELYLNRVYFGGGAWGVEAASERYFGKPASDVSLGEAALLAGLLKAPSRDNPVADTARAEARATVVLDVMTETGRITPAERDAAFAEPVRVRASANPGLAGHFVDWISADVREAAGGRAGDLVVRTTLDLDMQRAAERAVTAVMDAEGGTRGAAEAALVAIDGDGAVRAMTGGRDYATSQFNRATQALRQPGSAFKPFIYTAAMEAGMSPWTVRADTEIQLGDWSPTNYEDEHLGDIALITALAKSINTVAVSVGEEVGRDHVIAVAHRLGVTSKIEPLRSLALGVNEVTLTELVSAYEPFANQGWAATPYGVVSIETADGDLVWRRDAPAPRRVLEARPRRLMNQMLARVVEEGTGRGAALPDRPSAGKTGTTDDFRDAWYVGYVPGFVAGVWVGNDDFTPMNRVTGGALPARIWRTFMGDVLSELPPRPLELPDGSEVEPQPDVVGPGPSQADRDELSALIASIAAVDG